MSVLLRQAWSDMADAMGRLDAGGVGVAAFLTTAHGQGVGFDRAMATRLHQQPAPETGPAPADRAEAMGSSPSARRSRLRSG
ncbi:hypothetical protein ACIA98_40110 [Streptomyces sp. NPDC051366]|uniref:hypothetical protein n=1 Tax=Streptomyces sp. NPDC051366 TaxID=3365652 RepID=UPI00378C7640